MNQESGPFGWIKTLVYLRTQMLADVQKPKNKTVGTGWKWKQRGFSTLRSLYDMLTSFESADETPGKEKSSS